MQQKAELETREQSRVRKGANSKSLLKSHAPATQDAASPLLNMQRSHGNRHVQSLLKSMHSPSKCSCGASGGQGQCDSCSKKQAQKSDEANLKALVSKLSPLDMALSSGATSCGGKSFGKDSSSRNNFRAAGPSKSMHEDREEYGPKPRPMQGGATIQCDGSGGYEIDYGGYAGNTCGTKDCVTAHESSHIADWRAKWPKGCDGQPKGYLPKGDPPDNPLMTVAEYNSFRDASECKAHTVDLQCAEALPKTGGCKQTVEDYIKLTKKQKDEACALSLADKIALAIWGVLAAGVIIGGLASVFG